MTVQETHPPLVLYAYQFDAWGCAPREKANARVSWIPSKEDRQQKCATTYSVAWGLMLTRNGARLVRSQELLRGPELCQIEPVLSNRGSKMRITQWLNRRTTGICHRSARPCRR